MMLLPDPILSKLMLGIEKANVYAGFHNVGVKNGVNPSLSQQIALTEPVCLHDH